MKRVIIFDFDGTLADTLETNLKIIKDLKLNHGREITIEMIEDFKNTSVPDFLKKNSISKIKMYLRFGKIKRELKKRINTINIFPGMKEEIGKLHRAGFRLGILSSNDKDNIESFLKKYDLSKFFDFVYTEKNIFSKDTKLKFIRQFLKLSDTEMIYVGDEIRDIEAAKKAGVKNIAVTWGYNSRRFLETKKPGALIDNPKQIKSAIDSI